jgi:xanthine dehydrogenase molybdenum-binding subunit
MTTVHQSGAPFQVVGERLPKVDAADKVTGRTEYVDDLRFRGLLVARLVRSWEPHARVAAVDASAALAVPGVVAVLSHENIRKIFPALAATYDPACHDFERVEPFAPEPGDASLFDGVARYVGDPVAVVVAETEEAAVEAAGMVDVRYEPRPPVFSTEPEPGSPLLHEGATGNLASSASISHGDCDAAFAAAAAVVGRRFETSKQKQAQMEPTGCVAEVRGGLVTVWSPTQSPHRARHTLAHLFGLPLNRVRVTPPAIGGGFGKGDALTAEPYAVALALFTGRPVKLVYSRTEDFVGTESRHPTASDVEAAFDADGRVMALRGTIIMDAGAYLSHSPRIAIVLAKQLHEMYAIPNVDIEVSVRFTNLPVSGAFRGYGGPQAAFIIEHLIDLGARQLGTDPATARELMLGEAEGHLGVSRTNVIACVQRGRAKLPAPGPAAPGTRRGVGLACVNWKSGIADKPGSFDRSVASVRVNEDATLDVLSGACDLGTGITTTLAQIAAEVFGLNLAAVRVTAADTEATPFDSGAFSSRSLFRAGGAVLIAAEDARSKVLSYAAEVLEADVADLEISDGTVSVVGAPAMSTRLKDLLHRGLMESRDFNGFGDAPSVGARSACAQVAEVEVDTATGQTTVVRLVAVQEVGRAINPTIVEGQIEGGVYQGLGYALAEDVVADKESGALLTGTFMDYRLLTAADGPRIETEIIEMPAEEGPFGAKGVAEPGIILTAAAVANAILDAVGAAPTALPMTAERVLAALRQAASEPRATSIP